MRWFWLVPKDQRHNNWILFAEGTPTILRERYRSFQCRECGKVDEDAALRMGIDAELVIKARSDVVETSDNVLCFSSKAQQALLESGVVGLEFLPLFNKSRYAVALPLNFVKVERELAGFEYDDWVGYANQTIKNMSEDAEAAKIQCQRYLEALEDAKKYTGFCSVCGRSKGGTYVGPLKRSFMLPDDPKVICAPDLSAETVRSKRYQFLVSEIVKDELVASRITGIEFIPLR